MKIPRRLPRQTSMVADSVLPFAFRVWGGSGWGR